MKTFSKRISAVLLSVYMVFGVVSTDYLTVQAFEWVVPSLTFGQSFGWLMGLLGLTYQGTQTWSSVAPEYEQDFIDYALEHGMTYNQTNTWMNDVAIGKLNQISDVWDTFKSWCKSLVSSSVSVPTSVSNVIDSLQNFYGTNYSYSSLSSEVLNFNFKSAIFYQSQSGSLELFLFSDVRYFQKSGGYLYCYPYPYSSGYNITLDNTTNGTFIFRDSFAFSFSSNPSIPCYYIGFSNNAVDVDSNYTNIMNGDFIFSSSSETSFVSLSPDSIDAFSLALQGAISSAIPDVIDLPWQNLGDNVSDISDSLDSLIEAVNTGALSITDFMSTIQDLLGVLTVGLEGVLYPTQTNPDTGKDNTLDDEVAQNKSNAAFILSGLEKVFPFCIPFDLYAFITLLEAPPVAPVIQYPIYNPVTKSNEIITIDFSTWESVVVLFRYIFDFLFIIGLLLMARALIGGGDSA